jgi:hypothetical protein
MTFKGMLDDDFSAILQTQKGADNGSALFSEGVSCNVVGDCEQN